MGNQIQLFTNQLFGNVRAIEVNGVMWFVATDVATCLGYTNPQKAVRDHVNVEDKIGGSGKMTPPSLALVFTDSIGRQQTQYPIWINESGIYSLLLKSRMPKAKQINFKEWITDIVVPGVRKIHTDNPLEIIKEYNN